MIIDRKEKWGTLKYNTLEHRFYYIQNNGNNAIPYTQNPIVLNLDLTMKCNMNCIHCVTKDFKKNDDLVVSEEMIEWINESPFMVVVITGGESFLPEYEENLTKLLKMIHNKGLIIDTNGTITPSKNIIEWIIKTDTLIRISWDSVRPQDEIRLRQVNGSYNDNLKFFYDKIKRITLLQSYGIDVAVQSVVHGRNIFSISEMPSKLLEYSIKQWYLQRLIPSHLIANSNTFKISDIKYNEVTNELRKICNEKGIECITKKDRRHNSVFLLIRDGLLYTQGENPGQKILLGKIQNEISFFDYVSSSDHSERYYG